MVIGRQIKKTSMIKIIAVFCPSMFYRLFLKIIKIKGSANNAFWTYIINPSTLSKVEPLLVMVKRDRCKVVNGPQK